MSNQINSKNIYAKQIEELLEAIAHLKNADNRLGFEDDGSGPEYTSYQHEEGRQEKELACDLIQSAYNVLIHEV